MIPETIITKKHTLKGQRVYHFVYYIDVDGDDSWATAQGGLMPNITSFAREVLVCSSLEDNNYVVKLDNVDFTFIMDYVDDFGIYGKAIKNSKVYYQFDKMGEPMSEKVIREYTAFMTTDYHKYCKMAINYWRTLIVTAKGEWEKAHRITEVETLLKLLEDTKYADLYPEDFI